MDADDTEQQTTHQGASGDSASDACDIAPAPRTADIHDDAPTVDFTVSQTRQLPPADGSVAQVGGQSVSEQSDSISLGSSTSTGNQLDRSDAARDPSAASQDVGRPERTADTATTDDTTAQDTSHRARGSKHRGTPGKPSNSKLARRLIAVVAAIVIFLAGAGTAIVITTYRQRQNTARQTAHASNGTTAGAPAKSSRTASAADYIKAMQSFTADAGADKLAYQVTGKTTNLAASDTPYGKHGKLSVGTTDGLSAPTILDEHGMPFQLRGASTHGLQWFGQYVNRAAFQSLRDEWGLNMVRLAVYPREGGYLQGSQAQMDKTIEQGVQAATDLGMYVIIDWHVLNYNPNGDVAQAESFFKSYAAKYKSYGNVIFEVCNEPTGTPWYDGSGNDIYSYCTRMAKAIRDAGSDAIILCGTNTWSQDIDAVAGKPLSADGFDNIMYVLHFYAATHKDDLRAKLQIALNAGTPVFVSEFGLCDASGNGGIDQDSANAWMTLLAHNNISYAAWALSNKAETAAFFKPSVTATSGWTGDDLTPSAIWLVNTSRKLTDFADHAASGTSSGSSKASSGAGAGNGKKSSASASSSPSVASGGLKATAAIRNQWNSGATYAITVSNASDSKHESAWQVTFDLDAEIADIWGGTIVSHEGAHYVVAPMDWNTAIEAGASAEIGFNASSTGQASQPQHLSVQ